MRFHQFCLLAGSGLIAHPALAQDRDWSGFYIGADIGLARSNINASSIDTVAQLTNINPAGAQPLTIVPATTVGLLASDSRTTFSYGGVVGFLAQSGGVVFGLEGDVQGPRELATATQTNTLPATLLSPASTLVQVRDAETRYSWSLRGRIGASLGQTMLYAAGGIAGASVDVDALNTYNIPAGNSAAGIAAPTIGPIATSASARGSLVGWTGGAGLEQMLGRRLSAGIDVRYSDYGSKALAFNNVAISRAGATSFPGAEGGFGTIGPPNTDPRSDPGLTRVDLAEWRVALRMLLRF